MAGPEKACLVEQHVKARVLLGGWDFFLSDNSINLAFVGFSKNAFSE